jgi:hypothetical protein
VEGAAEPAIEVVQHRVEAVALKVFQFEKVLQWLKTLSPRLRKALHFS